MPEATDDRLVRMGQLGDYIGLKDKHGNPIRIGQVIQMEDASEREVDQIAFGRVWYMPPEVCARRVGRISGDLLEGSYSLVDWGYGEEVPEFTVIDGHPGATWPPKEEKDV